MDQLAVRVFLVSVMAVAVVGQGNGHLCPDGINCGVEAPLNNANIDISITTRAEILSTEREEKDMSPSIPTTPTSTTTTATTTTMVPGTKTPSSLTTKATATTTTHSTTTAITTTTPSSLTTMATTTTTQVSPSSALQIRVTLAGAKRTRSVSFEMRQSKTKEDKIQEELWTIMAIGSTFGLVFGAPAAVFITRKVWERQKNVSQPSRVRFICCHRNLSDDRVVLIQDSYPEVNSPAEP